MSDTFTPRVGGIMSADIAVPDHEREVRFYSRVISTGESPLWREDLMNNLGMPVIGLGPRSEEYAHLPLQWMPHIQVADVAASMEPALALEGSELMHGKNKDRKSQPWIREGCRRQLALGGWRMAPGKPGQGQEEGTS